MLDTRLTLALDAGLALPDAGKVAAFRPPADIDLSHLDTGRVQVIHDSRPLYDHWAEKGYEAVRNTQDRYAAAIVSLPRAKADARALIAEACAVTDGPVVIDGQKTDGVDSILRDMRRRVTVQGPISKAHGKIFWIDAGMSHFFEDWQAGPSLTDGGFWTAPGVFSADAVDLGSAMLADALPERMEGQVADLGAGWGYLSAHVLTRPQVEEVHLVEAGHMALECARRNVTDDRATFHWADVTTWEPPQRMQAVVMNPPFHTGRAAEPAMGQAFVAAAARVLGTHGTLWMVANRHLPYEAELNTHFAEVEELGGDARFKLFRAHRPTGRSRRS